MALTLNEYQLEALRTESDNGIDITSTKYKVHPFAAKLNNGLQGLNGEAGEAIDILKKHIYQGHELDIEHIAKELGDVAWYLAVSAYAIGYDLETICQMNIDKLKDRYPGGFDADLSMNRKENDI